MKANERIYGDKGGINNLCIGTGTGPRGSAALSAILHVFMNCLYQETGKYLMH